MATGDPTELLWQIKARLSLSRREQGQDTGERRGVPSALPGTHRARPPPIILQLQCIFGADAGDLCAAPARLAGWLAHAPAAAASTPYIFPFPPA